MHIDSAVNCGFLPLYERRIDAGANTARRLGPVEICRWIKNIKKYEIRACDIRRTNISNQHTDTCNWSSKCREIKHPGRKAPRFGTLIPKQCKNRKQTNNRRKVHHTLKTNSATPSYYTIRNYESGEVRVSQRRLTIRNEVWESLTWPDPPCNFLWLSWRDSLSCVRLPEFELPLPPIPVQ